MSSRALAHGGASPRSARRARLPLAAFLSIVVLLAGGGAYLAVGIVAGDDAESGPGAPIEFPAGPFAKAQEIPVSFGALTVPNVQLVAGVKPKDVAGQTHFQSYIGPDKQQVHTSVWFTNLTGEPVKYSPEQFRLVVGRGDAPKPGDKRVAPGGGTINAGTLQPDAGIEGRLTFIAPRDRSRLWLEFKDPKQAKPVVIDLGRTGRTPPDAFKGFQHGGHG